MSERLSEGDLKQANAGRLFQQPYSEKKDHPIKMRVWRVVNATIFPLLPRRLRLALLRAFGAKVERNLVTNPSTRIYAPWNLEVKAPWAVLGPRVEVYNKAKVTLGPHAIVSQDAYLCTASHDVSSPVMKLVTKPIALEADTWVASKAVVLPGVTMHEGAVAGCGAVVSKDVDPWIVVGGNPAKFIKVRELKS